MKFIVHISGPEQSGFVAKAPEQLTVSKRQARTFATRSAAESHVARVLALRLSDEPAPDETVAWITAAEASL